MITDNRCKLYGLLLLKVVWDSYYFQASLCNKHAGYSAKTIEYSLGVIQCPHCQQHWTIVFFEDCKIYKISLWNSALFPKNSNGMLRTGYSKSPFCNTCWVVAYKTVFQGFSNWSLQGIICCFLNINLPKVLIVFHFWRTLIVLASVQEVELHL